MFAMAEWILENSRKLSMSSHCSGSLFAGKLSAELSVRASTLETVSSNLSKAEAELADEKQFKIDAKEELLKKHAELQEMRESYENRLKETSEERGMRLGSVFITSHTSLYAYDCIQQKKYYKVFLKLSGILSKFFFESLF